jgi:hypothetical protein
MKQAMMQLHTSIDKEELKKLRDKEAELKNRLKENELKQGFSALEVCIADVIKGESFRRVGFEDVSMEEVKEYVEKHIQELADMVSFQGYNEVYAFDYSEERRMTGEDVTWVTVRNISHLNNEGKPKNMKDQWKAFYDTGLTFFVNTFLRIFGWEIVMIFTGTDVIVFPDRCAERGFHKETMRKAYDNLRSFMAKECVSLESISH